MRPSQGDDSERTARRECLKQSFFASMEMVLVRPQALFFEGDQTKKKAVPNMM